MRQNMEMDTAISTRIIYKQQQPLAAEALAVLSLISMGTLLLCKLVAGVMELLQIISSPSTDL
jgi:hypothetical protein